MLSAIVLAVTTITKFAHGAWLVVLLIPLIVWACRKIHAHYAQTHEALIPSVADDSLESAIAPRSPNQERQPAALHYQQPDVTLTVIVPEVAFRRRCQRALHGRIAPHLRRALRPLSAIAVTSIPFHLR